MTLASELRRNFSFVQRAIYNVRKYWFIVMLGVASLWLLNRMDPVAELMALIVSTTARLSVGLFVAEMYWKFRLPKIGLQSAIIDDNISATLVYIAIIIASALV